ncbi:MAG: hypothetical protein ACREOO_08960 [bacterium]
MKASPKYNIAGEYENAEAFLEEITEIYPDVFLKRFDLPHLE